MLRHGSHLMLAGQQPVSGNLLVAGINLDQRTLTAYANFLPGIFPRHRIAVALPGDIGIAGYAPQLLFDERIRRASGDRLQVGLLGFPSLFDHAVCGAMHALVGYFPGPGPQGTVHIVYAMRLASLQATQEVTTHVLYARFYFALRLRAIGTAQARDKPPVTSEVQKLRLPDDFAALISSQPDRLHAVI